MIRLAFLLLVAALSSLSLAGENDPKSSLITTPSQEAEACRAQLKEYHQSIECFAPYRTAKGGVRPEAYQHCKEVKQPRGCHYSMTSAPPTRHIDRAPPTR